MPSGPKKRKSAKRKMESLGLIGSNNGDSNCKPPTTLLSPGNESESGGEIASPTTPGDSGFERELFEFERSAEAMDGASNHGGKKSAGEGAAVPVSNHGATEAGDEHVKSAEIHNSEGKHPAGGIEHKETEKGSGTGSSELKPSQTVVSREEKKDKPVPVSEPAHVVQHTSSTPQKEAVAKSSAPVENVKASKSVETPSDGKEKKAVNSSNSSSTKASGGGEKHQEQQKPHAEKRENRNEAALPPQTGHQTSWMNCCGLLDLFKGSHSHR